VHFNNQDRRLFTEVRSRPYPFTERRWSYRIRNGWDCDDFINYMCQRTYTRSNGSTLTGPETFITNERISKPTDCSVM
jgi:hypothetical protein